MSEGLLREFNPARRPINLENMPDKMLRAFAYWFMTDYTMAEMSEILHVQEVVECLKAEAKARGYSDEWPDKE